MPKKKRKPITVEHFNLAIEQMIVSKTDREIAILGGAFLEGLLFDIMEKALVDSPFYKNTNLFQFPNPLSSFGNLLSLGFAFGVISEEEYSMAMIVKKIRNHAAHSIGLDDDDFDFSTEPVRSMLFEFYPQKAYNSASKKIREKIKKDFDSMMEHDAGMQYRLIFCNAGLRLITRRDFITKIKTPAEINEGENEDEITRE